LGRVDDYRALRATGMDIRNLNVAAYQQIDIIDDITLINQDLAPVKLTVW
jgi:hypothetical protein